jgi:AcrR family transcriptional regulator
VGKSERTREQLLAAALELFTSQGYHETTVAQIAARVGVSEMTFFRHFPSKEDSLLADPYDPLIAAAVAEQPREWDVLRRVVQGVRAAWHAVPEPAGAQVRLRVRIAAQTPSLRAAIWRNTEATEQVIVAALEADGTDRLAARAASAAVLAGITAALLEWAATDEGELGPMVDRVLALFESEVEVETGPAGDRSDRDRS